MNHNFTYYLFHDLIIFTINYPGLAGDGRSSSVEAFDGPVVAPSTYGIVGDIRHGGDIVAVINVAVPKLAQKDYCCV